VGFACPQDSLVAPTGGDSLGQQSPAGSTRVQPVGLLGECQAKIWAFPLLNSQRSLKPLQLV
jgi:hypothetical protein